MASNAKQRAKKKGHLFTITRLDILDLKDEQDDKCALTGWELNWKLTGQGRRVCPINRVSLDRIDSTKGYTRDNIQLVCDIVNRCKNAYSEGDFVAMCKAISERA